MKHSPPFIAERVEADATPTAIERAVGIVMAPHWSGMSVETYIERVRPAVVERRRAGVHVRASSATTTRRSSRSSTARVREALTRLAAGRARERGRDLLRAQPSDADARRRLACGARRCDCVRDRCRTATGCSETADARRRPRSACAHYTIAWQSAGRTADPWWGPPIEDVIPRARGEPGTRPWWCARRVRRRPPRDPVRPRHRGARRSREDAGIAFARTEMPNADPAFLDVLGRGRRATTWREAGVTHAATRGRGASAAASPASPPRTAWRPAPAPLERHRARGRRARVGGKLRSIRVGELDARGRRRLVRRPQAVGGRAVRGAGLATDSSRRAPSGAYAVDRARLVPMRSDAAFGIPGDVGEVLRGPGCRARGGAARCGDLRPQAPTGAADESLGSLLRRRLGDEATERSVAPLLGGLVRRRRRPAVARVRTFPELVELGGATREPDPRLAGGARARPTPDGSLVRCSSS